MPVAALCAFPLPCSLLWCGLFIHSYFSSWGVGWGFHFAALETGVGMQRSSSPGTQEAVSLGHTPRGGIAGTQGWAFLKTILEPLF